MAGERQNQQGRAAGTDAFAIEDESVTTNKAATVIPLLSGEGKTSIRWLTPIYGQRVVKIPTATAGKGGK